MSDIVIIDDSFFHLSAAEQRWLDREVAACPPRAESASVAAVEAEPDVRDLDIADMKVLDETEEPLATSTPRKQQPPRRRGGVRRGRRSNQKRAARRRIANALRAGMGNLTINAN